MLAILPAHQSIASNRNRKIRFMGFALAVALSTAASGGEDDFEKIGPIYLETDPKTLMHATAPASVERMRQYMIHEIWRGKGFPASDAVNAENLAPEESGFAKAKTYARFTVNMEAGFKSVVYFIEPKDGNDRLMIYHQGHGHTWSDYGGRTAAEFFYRRGYAILIFLMPLFGANKGRLANHDALSKVEAKDLNPMKFFFEPIAVCLNYLQKNRPFKDIGMIGISGGGWTTHLYAAMDPRIRMSFPFAGSLPMYLRKGPFHGKRDAGDWEQKIQERLPQISYLDVYIMAAYGENRVHLHVLNKYDNCCFAGVRYRTFEPHVKERMKMLGKGQYAVYLDDTHREHQISKHALEHAVAPLLPKDPGK